jgi:hypothetical protein
VPFSPQTLKERVLRKFKKRDGSWGAVMAHYIETRDMADRLNYVVGDPNWDISMQVVDFGDRIGVVANLRIGGVVKTGEGEERKLSPRKEYVDNPNYDPQAPRTDPRGQKRIPVEKIDYNELGVTKAGPQACKRAGVWFGIAEYLYKFPEDIVKECDQYGKFEGGIDFKTLPAIAIPPSGQLMILQELAALFRRPMPDSLADLTNRPEDVEFLGEKLREYWGIESLKSSTGLTEEDHFRLAGCIARLTDRINHDNPFAEPDDAIRRVAASGRQERSGLQK